MSAARWLWKKVAVLDDVPHPRQIKLLIDLLHVVLHSLIHHSFAGARKCVEHLVVRDSLVLVN